MHGERSARVVTSAAIALSVAAIPGLAQSNAVRWRTASPAILVGSALNGVAVYVEPSTLDAERPPNLSVPSTFGSTIDLMLERSPTFRRQCSRVAAAVHLSVAVSMLHLATGGPRARTQISREDSGRLRATVEISPGGDFVELLAHELEHIIEQLDGIDLAAMASVARSGVRTASDGVFETNRAVRVGTLVALEARSGR